MNLFNNCEQFEKYLKYTCQRFSNNGKQDLTEKEIMTIHIFALIDFFW